MLDSAIGPIVAQATLSGRVEIMKTRIILALSALLIATTASADSLVYNGDFGLGALGFDTDYTYAARAPESMWPEGTYTIDTTAAGIHSLWETGGDHTGAGGQFMIVNGSTELGQTVWAQTVSTIMGWTYDFSLWAKNMCCIQPGDRPGPQLSFWINGSMFGDGLTDGPGVWQEFGGQFLASSHTARLEVRNASTVFDGNDYGLDDISVTHSPAPVPEPMSLVLLGSGLAVIVRRMRRA